MPSKINKKNETKQKQEVGKTGGKTVGGKTGGRKGPKNKLRANKGKLKSITPKNTSDKEQFYCVSCKKNVRKNRAEKNITVKQAKNGRWMMQSSCGTCDTKLTRFISNATAEAWTSKQ